MSRPSLDDQIDDERAPLLSSNTADNNSNNSHHYISINPKTTSASSSSSNGLPSSSTTTTTTPPAHPDDIRTAPPAGSGININDDPPPPYDNPSTKSSKFNPFKSLRTLKASPLLILPPLFLHALGASMGMAPMSQFLLLVVCQSMGLTSPAVPTTPMSPIFNGTSHPMFMSSMMMMAGGGGPSYILSGHGNMSTTVPPIENFPDYELCAARPEVQADAAKWSQLISLATAIPAFLVAPMVGYFIDRLGRKTMMLVPLFSALLGVSSIIAVAKFKFSLWLLVIIHVFQGILGGPAILITCVYAYLADTTTSTARTQSFLFTDAFTFTAFTIGPFLGGILYRNLGLVRVFELVVGMELLVFMYVLFILPESMRSNQQQQQQQQGGGETQQSGEGGHGGGGGGGGVDKRTPLQIFFGSWGSVLDVLATPGRGSSVRVLSMVTAVGAMVFSAYQYVFFFYPSKRFGWDSYDNGLFSLTNSLCRLFYLVVLLPWLLRRWSVGMGSVEKTRLELGIVRVGMLLYMLGFTAFGLASEGWMFYLSEYEYYGVVFIFFYFFFWMSFTVQFTKQKQF
jgi:MFS family permease